MNYQKLYDKLMQTRKERELIKEKGYEIHHIVPKCLGGDNEEDNLVKLTFREHYIAHWILAKIYINNPKIHYGFLCMLRSPNENRRLTSRMVETIKNNFSNFKKWQLELEPSKNPGKTKNSITKARKRMLENNPMRETPEKNHTAKKVFVEYQDGTKKVFSMKKQLAKELRENTNLTESAIRRRINENSLQEYGYKSIKLEIKENKPANSCIGRKWYNDGKKNVFCFPGKQPKNFKPGVIKKDAKEKIKIN